MGRPKRQAIVPVAADGREHQACQKQDTLQLTDLGIAKLKQKSQSHQLATACILDTPPPKQSKGKNQPGRKPTQPKLGDTEWPEDPQIKARNNDLTHPGHTTT